MKNIIPQIQRKSTYVETYAGESTITFNTATLATLFDGIPNNMYRFVKADALVRVFNSAGEAYVFNQNEILIFLTDFDSGLNQSISMPSGGNLLNVPLYNFNGAASVWFNPAGIFGAVGDGTSEFLPLIGTASIVINLIFTLERMDFI